MKSISEYEYRKLQIADSEKSITFIYADMESGLAFTPSLYCRIKTSKGYDNYRLYVEFLDTSKTKQVLKKILMRMLILKMQEYVIPHPVQVEDESFKGIYYESDNLNNLTEILSLLNEAISEMSKQVKEICLRALQGYLDDTN